MNNTFFFFFFSSYVGIPLDITLVGCFRYIHMISKYIIHGCVYIMFSIKFIRKVGASKYFYVSQVIGLEDCSNK